MSDTPRTDAFFRPEALRNLDKYPAAKFARELERELAAARADAARYRFLKGPDGNRVFEPAWYNTSDGAEFDAWVDRAIDAAMAKEPTDG